MDTVDVRVLGELSIRYRGRVVSESDLGGRRAAVVFARLLMARAEVIHRDQLALALWRDERPGTWRSSLRNVVADIRRGLVGLGLEDLLRTREQGYVLVLPATTSTDIDGLLLGSAAVEELLQRGDVAPALAEAGRLAAMAEQPVLAGLDTPFAQDLRQQVRSAGIRMRLVQGRIALVAGQPEVAEMSAHRVLASSPYREDARRLLIEALHAAGNRAAALRAYEDCRRLLADELGISPSPETQALFSELLAEDADAAVTTDPSWSLLLGQRTPEFVGRSDELEKLDGVWASVSGTAGIVVVDMVGESGIGKTMLAAEFTARLRSTGARVLYGRAADRLDVPYRPVLEALDSYLATLGPGTRSRILGEHAADLARLLPSVREVASPSRGHGMPDLEQMHLFRAITGVLSAIAGEAGALLVLDDMHWSDLAIVDLVRHLQQHGRGPLMVVSLRRPSREPASDTWPGSDRLTLGPLTVTDVADLSRRLGRSYNLADARALWEESGGNPLYAAERLRLTDPRAKLDGADDLPSRLQEVVRQRIAGLPTLATRVLGTAAVVGLEFDPETVIAAGDVVPEVASVILGVAERDGILVPATSHPQWRAFRHALIRNVLLAEMERPVEMELHRRVGHLMEARPPTLRSSIPDLAHHFEIAAPLGDWRRAVRYHHQVARSALDNLVLGDAILAADRALEVLIAAGDPDTRARVESLILSASGRRLRGDADATDALDHAYAEAHACGDAVLIARAALAYSISSQGGDEVFLDMGRIEIYRDALDRLPEEEGVLRARLLGCMGSGYSWTMDAQESARLVEEASVLARQVGDLATLSTVLSNKRRTLTGSGRAQEALELEAELFVLADQLGDPLAAARGWLWRFETAIELGRADDVEHALARAERAVEDYGPATDGWSLRYYQAAKALLRGEVEEADVRCEAAADFGRARGMAEMPVEGLRLIQLMGIRHEQGRLRDLRDELVTYFDAAGVVEWRTANAFVDAELGDLDAVGPVVASVIEGYRAAGARVATGVGLALHLASPVARAEDAESAAFLYDMLAPYAGRGGFVAYFTGPLDWALGLAAETRGDRELARGHFDAAADFSRRLGAPRWEGRALAARDRSARDGLDWRPGS